jgi:hypothetical protein
VLLVADAVLAGEVRGKIVHHGQLNTVSLYDT